MLPEFSIFHLKKNNLFVKLAVFLSWVIIGFIVASIIYTPAHAEGVETINDDYVVSLTTEKISDEIMCIYELHDLMNSSFFNHVKRKKDIIEAICESHVKYNVPYQLIASIIWTESTFNNKAKNKTSIGLMQINTKYHKEKDLKSIQGNIDYGVKYIKKLVDLTGSFNKAVSMYNGGTRNKTYVTKIAKNQSKLFGS